MAKHLSEAGLKVALLEAGPERVVHHDDLAVAEVALRHRVKPPRPPTDNKQQQINKDLSATMNVRSFRWSEAHSLLEKNRAPPSTGCCHGPSHPE